MVHMLVLAYTLLYCCTVKAYIIIGNFIQTFLVKLDFCSVSLYMHYTNSFLSRECGTVLP